MLFALCLLLSSSQLTSLSPIPFSIFRYKINSRFYRDDFRCAQLFFNLPVTNFQFTSDKFPAKFSNENLLMTRDPRKLVTPFPVTLELKIKNKGK